jgi:hypothetical protein
LIEHHHALVSRTILLADHAREVQSLVDKTSEEAKETKGEEEEEEEEEEVEKEKLCGSPPRASDDGEELA